MINTNFPTLGDGGIRIILKDLKFFSYHGLYAEEKILGNNFIVNSAITLINQSSYSTIEQTVDYTTVFAIIKKWMETPHEILEDLITKMAEDIFNNFEKITDLSLSIEKTSLPLLQFIGSVVVTHHKTRKR